MSQSIDFHINDLINEYLDSKGYSQTVEIFLQERINRQETITKTKTEQSLEKDKYKKIKDDLLKQFDHGNREQFFELWSESIPTSILDTDPSLKSLEFLLYTHFAVYYLRPNIPFKISNDRLAQENMQILKTYLETIRGQSISQTNDILPLFALPYVSEPTKHESFQDLFTDEWLKQLRTKLVTFFDWIFSNNRIVPNLVDILRKGERATEILGKINNEYEQIKYQNREINRQMKHISTDYCNLISITMELVETLQQAVIGKIITNDYIDNVCARLGLARLQEAISHRPESAILGTDELYQDRLDYGKIKRDIVNISINPRERALLLQALRWKLTKAKTDFQREKILECFIGCDLLGCRTDIEQRTKIIKQLSSAIGGDAYYVKEEWARLINTIASLRKGRIYLTPNESLVLTMQKTAISEASDTMIRQHLLAALQKLSLKRSIQSLMIHHNIIKWLIPLLNKTDRLSDYTLEYGVALLMNLCLRTSGRKKCAEIAEQAIVVLASLLTHPNQETRPYVNSSLYSILTLKSIREKALQLNLDHRLRSLIRTEKTNSETKGQLEFLLNLLYKGGDQDGRQTSDNEQDNDDEDQDIMEVDLDLGDKLHGTDQELSGEKLIDIRYISPVNRSFSRPKSNRDSIVLNRSITPGQLRQSQLSNTIQTITDQNNQFYRSQSNGFEHLDQPLIFPDEQDKPLNSHRSNSIESATSSFLELNTKN